MSDPTISEPESASLTDDGRKYLDHIQTAVGRMSSASSTAKGWLLPVVTAAYGFGLTKHVPSVAVLGMAAVVIFGLLDANYLRQERAFRALYRDAAESKVRAYDMNVGKYLRPPAEGCEDRRERYCKWTSIARSWSVAGFYGPLFCVGAVAAIFS